MPTILRNKTATIEIDFNVNLQHIVTKGSFDVTILDGTDGATTVKYVWLLFRRAGQIKDNIRLDWRDVTPAVESAEELRDLLLAYNVPPALITGQKPDGTFDEVELTESANFKVSMQEFDQDYFNETPLPTKIQANDSSSIDAFGRWRTSDLETIFDSKQIGVGNSIFWDNQQISGSGTTTEYSEDHAKTVLSVSAATAGVRARQTKQRFNYQPGKSQLILVTFNLNSGALGISKKAGYFDADNGLFLELTDNVAYMVQRSYATSAAVDTKIAQTEWNVDVMDGTGISGVDLDFSKTQILIIDFEWLGVGRVRMGFVVDGIIYYTHQFLNANNLTSVYMSKPNLPVRYEIENDGAGGADSIDCICSSVSSEGGLKNLGITRGIHNGAGITLSTANTLAAAIGVRLKATELDSTILFEIVSIIADGNNEAFRWELILNPTVAGTFTFESVDATSALERAIGTAANTVTGGIILATGVGKDTSIVSRNFDQAYRLGSLIDGTPDVIVLAINNYTANVNLYAAINVRELL